MRYSEATDKLMAAMAGFQGEVTAPPKNRTVTIRTQGGAEYSYAYAELSEILKHVQPQWQKYKFCRTNSTPIENGKMLLRTRIGVEGQWMENDYPLPPSGDMKQQAGNITYGMRYNFNMMMGLASQEDADEMPAGNPRGGREDKQQQRRQQQAQPPPSAAPAQNSAGTGAGKQPQAGARITPATSVGSGGNAATAPAPAAPLKPGQKEREEIIDLCAANNWPAERVPEYLSHAYRVQRLDQLTMDQYGDLKKVITGDALFEEVMELIKPKPGDFGYVGPAPAAASNG